MSCARATFGPHPRRAVLAACLMVVSAGSACAGPMVVSERFDFRRDDGRSTGGAWTPGHSGGGPTAERWRWIGPTQRAAGRWADTPAGGRGQVDRVNFLTSPVIDVKSSLGQSADTFRLSIAQRFNFGLNGRGWPVAAGEIAYSLDGGSFVAIPTSAFTSGGSIHSSPFDGVASPFAAMPGIVNQSAFVAPRSAWTGPPPLLPGGGLFAGRSPGFARGGFVPTEAILDFRGTGVFFSTIQFRFIEAGLRSRCPPRSRWDVSYVQADFAAPEPGGLVLGGLGCLLTACGWWRGLWSKRRSPGRSLGRRGPLLPVDHGPERVLAIGPQSQVLEHETLVGHHGVLPELSAVERDGHRP